ncbi:PREDICTED: rhomboid-related protein 2-like [Ceratosolen solmsi marchali]|uniref:Rhomboid-related protein 2-like n=1 Tax=Ceratosolen solmsi marchali TaxID=326594 RepID=A0AAJ7DZ73_9HYME|nr:PREDICTED: rhomboid-related protein 2-like [Ceratosolen solmsi marchali]
MRNRPLVMCVTTPLSASKMLKEARPTGNSQHHQPPRPQQHTSIMMVRMIGDEFLTEERDRKYYADHYTCCPPPLFIILITLVEIVMLVYGKNSVTDLKDKWWPIGVKNGHDHHCENIRRT